MKVAEEILNIVYPRNIYCVCCNDMLPLGRVHSLCDKCIENLKWISENPFTEKLDEFSFDEVLSLVYYDMYAQNIVHKLKFQSCPYVAKPIGRLMGELLNRQDVTIVAVPMYIEKKKLRGYNQAELLGIYAAKASKAYFLKDGLIKIKPTASMRSLRADDRKNSIRDSVIVNEALVGQIKGRNIVVVDDVITTGTTADICAEALKNCGAKKVTILSFAAVNYKGN